MAKCQSWLSLLHPLQQLLSQGVCDATDTTREQLCSLLIGIAAKSSPLLLSSKDEQTTSSQFVAARPLLHLRQKVDNDNEAMAAILATVEVVRNPWLAIIAARTKEAGQMEQPERLVQLVSQLKGASQWVESALPLAKITPTPLGELERRLFNTVAESAQAVPILCRVLAAAAWLQDNQNPLPAIMPVDISGERPDLNWCKGRLLEIPSNTKEIGHQGDLQSFLLSGMLNREPQKRSDQDPLPWVLRNPWAFLLASLIYTQDSWAAEQRGGLLLELPSGQSPLSPNQIQILVAKSDGEELLCGSLAEFILRWLERRQVHLFPSTPKVSELDSRLGSVVQALLTKKVWRYYDGLSGQQGYYGINQEFADLCYRRLGSKIFQRYGRTIWQDFRVLAEEWARESRSAKQSKHLQGAAA